jgi:hypothetical protein
MAGAAANAVSAVVAAAEATVDGAAMSARPS